MKGNNACFKRNNVYIKMLNACLRRNNVCVKWNNACYIGSICIVGYQSVRSVRSVRSVNFLDQRITEDTYALIKCLKQLPFMGIAHNQSTGLKNCQMYCTIIVNR